MLLDTDSLIDSMVKNQLKVSHLEKKVKAEVSPIKKVNPKLKEVIKKEYGADLLKDADYIIKMVEIDSPAVPQDDEVSDNDEVENIETTQDEESSNGDENSEKETEEDISFGNDTEEEDTEETEDDTEEETEEEETKDGAEDTEEDTEEDAEEDDTDDTEKEKTQTNESMKIQDLTKSMLTTITPKESINKAPKKESKKCECNKTKCKSEKCNCKKETLDEAETEATGAELKAKIEKAINQAFKGQVSEDNPIEIN